MQAKERIGFGEGSSAGNDFCAAVGDEVEGCELLEDADGVGSAEDSDGAGEADVLGAAGGCGEDYRRSGVEEFFAVMLADAEDVEADLVGEDDLFDEVVEALGGRDGN